MITNISIDGYKCLTNTSFPCGNLNILVGPNASGKSSVLQTLLLLRQSTNQNGKIKDLHLSGPLFEAGTAQDIMHPAAEHRISVCLNEDDYKNFEYVFNHDRDDKNTSPKRLLTANHQLGLPKSLAKRNNSFAYLNAERIGPRLTYSLPPDEMQLSGPVGKYGEYATALLARAKSDIFKIDGWNKKLASDLARAPGLLDKKEMLEDIEFSGGRLDLVCNEMLGWILPGASFDASELDQADAAALRFIRDPFHTKTSVRPTHIGFGLIYTLPIITAALALDKNGLLLVENPEAHLHPFSQSRIGVFLAMIAATGRQIFIETHSDHVLNGIRLAVRNKILPPENLLINFFERPMLESSTSITQIRTSIDGRLKPWPKGFFDQIENDLSRL
jgi:predicted ATPase